MSSHSASDVPPGDSKDDALRSTRLGLTNDTAVLVIVGMLFIGYSLISVPVPGVNEPHYLTKARSYANPEWCQNDFFLSSSDAHAVFFGLVGPLTKTLSFATIAVMGRVLSLSLLAIGWVMVGRRLGLKFHGICISAGSVCLIAMSGNFSGEWIIGGFESKVPAYGFAFLSVAYWLDSRSHPAISTSLKLGIMLGLAIALHPVVGAWFAIGFVVSEAVLYLAFVKQRVGLVSLLRNGFVTIASSFVCALPGLVPAVKLAMAADIDEGVQDSANRIQVYWRLAHHLDPSNFPAYSWIHTATLTGLCVLGLRLIMRSKPHVSGNSSSLDCRPWTAWSTLLCVSLVIALVGVVIGWHSGSYMEITDWEWRAKILRYYPFRFFDALLPCTLALIVGGLSDVWLRTSRNRTIAVTCFALSVIAFAANTRRNQPAAFSAASFEQWKQACEWLKQNTPTDSLIMGPRESFGMKWFAERAEYVCFKDCPQDGLGIVEWNARLSRLFEWAQASYDNRQFDDKDLQRLNKQTGITHVMTRRLGPFESPPVFRNQTWRIYEAPLND